ncbi:MAG: M23 family metallopeptidase [Eubacterium sp.]|nr:M23 family metallopeptidase [Eubacterium sp.]
MSSNSRANKGNKNLRALFSVICISIIALGLIVYFSTQNNNDPVNEPTTIVEKPTAVQNPVTLKETTAPETITQPTTQSTTQPTTQSTSMPLSDTNTPYVSFYKYPISETVLKGYTEELVYNDTMGDYRSHTAIDFKGAEGTDVYAINDGRVLSVYNDAMLGMTVEIDHGGKLVAKYSGLEVVNVSKGDPVMIGATIGTLGKVPFESAADCHLHLETRLDGVCVNPLDVMGKTD